MYLNRSKDKIEKLVNFYVINYLPTDVNEMNYINCYVLITTAGVH